MAGLIAAIDLKRKMYVEFEDAPYHMLDVEVSRPTARGGQTLVRVKMRNLLTRPVCTAHRSCYCRRRSQAGSNGQSDARLKSG